MPEFMQEKKHKQRITLSRINDSTDSDEEWSPNEEKQKSKNCVQQSLHFSQVRLSLFQFKLPLQP